MIQIILQKDVKNLGEKGSIHSVKNGYALNYLLPQEIAVLATEGRVRQAKEVLEARRRKQEELMAQLRDLSKEVDGQTLLIKMKANEEGHLYAAVTPKIILSALQEKYDFELSSDSIRIPTEIKEIGKYEVEVQFTGEVMSKVFIEVEAEKEI